MAALMATRKLPIRSCPASTSDQEPPHVHLAAETQDASQHARQGPPSGDGANGTAGSLRRLKGMLGRPIALDQRDGRLSIVLVDRRRAPAQQQSRSSSRRQLCDDLRARLLSDGRPQTLHVMRHLVFVLNELERRNWRGVESLQGHLLGNAVVQAEMLLGDEASTLAAKFLERLRILKAAADAREEGKSRRKDSKPAEPLEVCESTFEEFELMERSWGGTVPSALAPLDPEK